MATTWTPLRYLTRGFGGSASIILTAGFLTFPIIIDEIRRNLGHTKSEQQFAFEDDEVNVYKISAMLTEINKRPLDNVLYHKLTKLVIEKRIQIDVDFVSHDVKKSDPYKIVIGEYKVVREE